MQGLCPPMCGKAVPFRADALTFFAAMPPDVRKGCAFPKALQNPTRLCLEAGGIAAESKESDTERLSLSAHRAAQPQKQTFQIISEMNTMNKLQMKMSKIAIVLLTVLALSGCVEPPSLSDQSATNTPSQTSTPSPTAIPSPSPTATSATMDNTSDEDFLATGEAYQALPAKVRSYLKKNYSGYKLYAGSDPFCPQSRAVVSGNFNGDAKRDYAVMFDKGQSRYVIAFLSQGTNYKAHVLEGGSFSSLLYVGRKGEKYVEFSNGLAQQVTRRLKYDAPGGGICEASGYFWIYSNGRFRTAVTAD